nr:4015_t:CDS:2 [Entrophospora candida]
MKIAIKNGFNKSSLLQVGLGCLLVILPQTEQTRLTSTNGKRVSYGAMNF